MMNGGGGNRTRVRAYGGLLLLTDVTLPGTPEQERHRRNVALPWASGGGRVVDPKALHKANRRFKRRLRWLKRQAYNDARAALRKGGYEFDRLPPVLVGNLEVQKRGALHAHLALPYTTPLEMTFTRAYIESMRKWAPRCGLGYVQGWKAAEKAKLFGHERAIGYLTKYLTGKHPPGFLRNISGPRSHRLTDTDPPNRSDDGQAPPHAAALVSPRRPLRDARLASRRARRRRPHPRRPHRTRPRTLTPAGRAGRAACRQAGRRPRNTGDQDAAAPMVLHRPVKAAF